MNVSDQTFPSQVVNYNHMMPTRYSVDISFDKTNINKELMKVRYSWFCGHLVQQTCKGTDVSGGHWCGSH